MGLGIMLRDQALKDYEKGARVGVQYCGSGCSIAVLDVRW